jgi:predicted esterase
MLHHEILMSEGELKSKDGLLFLPGYGQSIEEIEPLLSSICRDMVRVLVQPPLQIKNKGKYYWAQFEKDVRPLAFDQEQIRTAIHQVLALALQVKEQHHLRRLFLSGFSQGAVVAAHAIDQAPGQFAGAVLSHPIILPALLEGGTVPLPPLLMLQSPIGTDDFVTAIDHQHMLEWLEARGSVVHRKEVTGGHAFTKDIAAAIESAISDWRKK